MGDWGVVNDQPRLATCVAVGDVELLMIADFNFKATVDQALLARLLEVRLLHRFAVSGIPRYLTWRCCAGGV